MSQVITHLKSQLSKLKLQLHEVKKQMAEDKEDLVTQLKKEKNLRLQVQEEKASLRVEMI